MTQVFTEDGKKKAVTVVDVSDVIVSKHLMDGEQVTHVEIGLGAKKKPAKADAGNYKRLGKVPAYKRTIKLDETETEIPEIGTAISANIFEIGDKVDVIGKTKGKGFQGVMKRWNFKGGPATHGGPTGKMRHGGSIGAGTTPGRVVKGKKMAGHMGDDRQTIQNLRIVQVDEESNLIAVAGSIPGPNGAYVMIKQAKFSK